MSIEQQINTFLQKTPVIKKVLKRSYQLIMYATSPKVKSEGNIRRLTPEDEYEYFFGYYDKSPWNDTEDYILSLRAKNTTDSVAPDEPADIVLINAETEEIEIVGQTHTWNVQQGSMLQWLGPDYKTQILYNDYRDGKYCSVILDLQTREERVLVRSIYSVSNDGKTALSIDFSRLHRLRKGYGYSNIEDATKDDKCPDEAAIWKLDIETNEATSILKYTDFANFEKRSEMEDAEHKVNHLMLNPSGERFMVLHRWIKGSVTTTRLVTCDIDGSNMYNLSDDNMVSHCFWKNDEEIIGFARKKETGNGYYLMKDLTQDYTHLFAGIDSDGHPSYSPDRLKIATDTYPNRSRIQSVYVLDEQTEKVNEVAKVFAPFKYDNYFRCDLHPRWNRSGTKISIDAVFEGKRALYEIMLDEEDLK
ncbi:hypothetical protein [Alkalibacterium sp. 20]|uniref:hypothetical protein n=1 Tax=Alkalibacterium sp. 20 TaxID=1798803 RepID=UPI0009000BD4|nr:hypothetical protein [Alkalibacterium sp. 20]OJF90673.1 hypothetical protein AX762_11640 [Alkalibacterium sp. 20]